MIPTYVLDSTNAPCFLDVLGAECCADKSPFNPVSHRHPYTPFYSMLFEAKRDQPLRFCEIGVAAGASVHMWAKYFSRAELFFFDRDMNFLRNARSFGYPNTQFHPMDVADADSINEGFTDLTGGNLDVILDDSSHDIEHQRTLIPEALKYLKPGGMMLVEDIFRNIPNEDYYKIIEPLKDQLGFFAFFQVEHKNRYSPGWDNDKILMLVKKY
jgi:predicted O-methyltransferase YrrM